MRPRTSESIRDRLWWAGWGRRALRRAIARARVRTRVAAADLGDRFLNLGTLPRRTRSRLSYLRFRLSLLIEAAPVVSRPQVAAASGAALTLLLVGGALALISPGASDEPRRSGSSLARVSQTIVPGPTAEEIAATRQRTRERRARARAARARAHRRAVARRRAAKRRRAAARRRKAAASAPAAPVAPASPPSESTAPEESQQGPSSPAQTQAPAQPAPSRPAPSRPAPSNPPPSVAFDDES